MTNKLLFPLTLLFLLILFWIFANSGLDPDFGWHLRQGQLILTKGIPATDPFSYSMPSYPFVDHEWLTNAAIAFLFPRIGFVGLVIIAASFAFLAIFLQTMLVRKKYLLFPLLLSGMALTSYLGIRPQIQSWVLASGLILLFLHERLWQKLRYLVPLLLLLWVNLHGSFALGIVLLGIFVGLKQLETKKLLLIDWLIVLASIAATFITPYYFRSWWEVWMQMTDTSLRWSIQEWFPAFFFFNVGFIFLFPLSLVLVIRYRKKIGRVKLVLYTVLLFFGLSSTRHLPFWLLIAIPITTETIEYFVLEIQKIPFAIKRLRIAALTFFIFFFLAFAGVIAVNFQGLTMERFSSYPESAVLFLAAHPAKGNLFSNYNWGGYLIWKLPAKKVFIDGRMPSWREATAPQGASLNAFKEYQAIMNGKTNPKEFFAKYHIDTVMIGAGDASFPAWLQENIERVLSVKFPNQQLFKKQLVKLGMKEIYKDKLVVIYRLGD